MRNLTWQVHRPALSPHPGLIIMRPRINLMTVNVTINATSATPEETAQAIYNALENGNYP